MSSLSPAGTSGDALATLQRVFGHAAFRGEQASIVDHVASGNDALVLMPTGGGKSLCFQIPALVRPGVAVVVSPLIALMRDQVDALRQVGVNAAYLNSSLDWRDAAEVERQVAQGELDLVYVAPERLVTPRFLDLLERSRVCLFALDEAHCVSQWGHDFRPEYLQLSILHERFPTVPRVALTATADEQTRADIQARLNLGDAKVFIDSFDRPNITYRVMPKQEPKRQLWSFIQTHHAEDAGIVYCLSRAKVDETAAWLAAQGREVVPYKLQQGNVNYELSVGCTAIADYLAELGGRTGARTDRRGQILAGFDAIAQQEEQLAERLLSFLRSRDGVRIIGNPSADRGRRVPTISFIAENHRSDEVVTRVDEHRIGIRYGDFYARRLIDRLGLTPAKGVVRVSMVHYNTVDEVDRLVEALDGLL